MQINFCLPHPRFVVTAGDSIVRSATAAGKNHATFGPVARTASMSARALAGVHTAQATCGLRLATKFL